MRVAKKLLLRNTKFFKEIGRRSSWSFLKGGLRSKPSTREKIEVIEMHGMKREDPFSWMNDTENASLKEYLLEEKLYCKSELSKNSKFEKKLYSEMTLLIPNQPETLEERYSFHFPRKRHFQKFTEQREKAWGVLLLFKEC